MATYKIKIDVESITRKASKAVEVKGLPAARKQAYGLYFRSKKMMLKEFDQHLVTNELKQGSDAKNISLSTEGYGNLFSFFGFEEQEDPTSNLRSLLDVGTSFRYINFSQRGWNFRITTPSRNVIEKETELNWGGGSWVDKVENGLDNLDHYLYKKGVGRSNQGIQAPFEINEDLSFQTSPYLTEILSNFRERINNSSINDI